MHSIMISEKRKQNKSSDSYTNYSPYTLIIKKKELSIYSSIPIENEFQSSQTENKNHTFS